MEHKALAEWLKNKFREQHPDIAVDVSFLDTYGITPASPLLGKGDEAVDLIEMDLTELPPLSGAVGTWSLPRESVIPAAYDASLVGGSPHAWPTYACTHVFYSTDATLRDVDTVGELVGFLRKAPAPSKPLIADLNGSSTLPAIYVDAYADRYGSQPTDASVNKDVASDLRGLVEVCGDLSGTTNECLNDSFDLYDGKLEGVRRFAGGEARALFGYSEYIYYALSAPGAKVTPSTLNVVSAPLSHGSQPLIYVDGLVRNVNCTDECARRAQVFAEFLTSREVQLALAFGEDVSPAAPRYLLMSRQTFWNDGRVKNDPLYQQLAPVVQTGKAFALPLATKGAVLEEILTVP
jgi:thiamine pyridinylase